MATLHVGTYAESGGRGLVPLTIGSDGSVAVGDAYPDAANASYGAHSARRGLHYLVDEQDEGAVSVLRCDKEQWRRLGRVTTGGAAPCFVALDAREERLAVANYGSGDVALFRLDERGLPGVRSMVRSSGSGPVADRQEGPHAHCVRFSRDGAALYLVDLGSDRVLRIALDGDGFGPAATAWQAPPGSGPRHLLFHPEAPLALVLSELVSELTVLAVEGDALKPCTACSTLPAGFDGESLGGHLALNAAGDRVYVSNRGDDSIAVFGLDATSGQLTLRQHIPSGGAHPRHFVLLERERLLIAAHEKDGRVEAFELTGDGRLAAIDRGVNVPGACFLLSSPSA